MDDGSDLSDADDENYIRLSPSVSLVKPAHFRTKSGDSKGVFPPDPSAFTQPLDSLQESGDEPDDDNQEPKLGKQGDVVQIPSAAPAVSREQQLLDAKDGGFDPEHHYYFNHKMCQAYDTSNPAYVMQLYGPLRWLMYLSGYNFRPDGYVDPRLRAMHDAVKAQEQLKKNEDNDATSDDARLRRATTMISETKREVAAEKIIEAQYKAKQDEDCCTSFVRFWRDTAWPAWVPGLKRWLIVQPLVVAMEMVYVGYKHEYIRGRSSFRPDLILDEMTWEMAIRIFVGPLLVYWLALPYCVNKIGPLPCNKPKSDNENKHGDYVPPAVPQAGIPVGEDDSIFPKDARKKATQINFLKKQQEAQQYQQLTSIRLEIGAKEGEIDEYADTYKPFSRVLQLTKPKNVTSKSKMLFWLVWVISMVVFFAGVCVYTGLIEKDPGEPNYPAHILAIILFTRFIELFCLVGPLVLMLTLMALVVLLQRDKLADADEHVRDHFHLVGGNLENATTRQTLKLLSRTTFGHILIWRHYLVLRVEELSKSFKMLGVLNVIVFPISALCNCTNAIVALINSDKGKDREDVRTAFEAAWLALLCFLPSILMVFLAAYLSERMMKFANVVAKSRCLLPANAPRSMRVQYDLDEPKQVKDGLDDDKKKTLLTLTQKANVLFDELQEIKLPSHVDYQFLIGDEMQMRTMHYTNEKEQLLDMWYHTRRHLREEYDSLFQAVHDRVGGYKIIGVRITYRIAFAYLTTVGAVLAIIYDQYRQLKLEQE